MEKDRLYQCYAAAIRCRKRTARGLWKTWKTHYCEFVFYEPPGPASGACEIQFAINLEAGSSLAQPYWGKGFYDAGSRAFRFAGDTAEDGLSFEGTVSADFESVTGTLHLDDYEIENPIQFGEEAS